MFYIKKFCIFQQLLVDGHQYSRSTIYVYNNLLKMQTWNVIGIFVNDIE